jgi:hypothetical protein
LDIPAAVESDPVLNRAMCFVDHCAKWDEYLDRGGATPGAWAEKLENESESFFRWSGSVLLISLLVAMWIASIYGVRRRLGTIFESQGGDRGRPYDGIKVFEIGMCFWNEKDPIT